MIISLALIFHLKFYNINNTREFKHLILFLFLFYKKKKLLILTNNLLSYSNRHNESNAIISYKYKKLMKVKLAPHLGNFTFITREEPITLITRTANQQNGNK